jgi:hypothetical protein
VKILSNIVILFLMPGITAIFLVLAVGQVLKEEISNGQ